MPPPAGEPKTEKHTNQISAVLLSLLVSVLACCGGGIAIAMVGNRSLIFLSAFLNVLGLFSFFGLIVVAIAAAIRAVWRRFSTPE